MGFLGWIILGLIVGAIVKAVMPGRVGGGWVTSPVLGVVGAVVGGWIGDLLFGGGTMEFWNLGSWLLAIVGGLVVDPRRTFLPVPACLHFLVPPVAARMPPATAGISRVGLLCRPAVSGRWRKGRPWPRCRG